MATEELVYAMRATAGLLKYLELLSDDNNCGKWKLAQLSMKDHMRLDAAAMQVSLNNAQ